MAQKGNPILQISVTIASDLKSFNFSDDTGVYASPGNIGGYETPNIAINDVSTVKVAIYQYGQTIPVIITFTVSSGTITAAIVTVPNGTSTNILSLLTSTVWPFSNSATNPLNIPNTWLGFSSTQTLPDMVWTFGYEIIGGYTSGTAFTFDLNTSIDELIDCTVVCCNKKQYVNLGNCGCDNNKQEIADRTWVMIKSAKCAAEVGQYEAAQCAITKAIALCGECKSCG